MGELGALAFVTASLSYPVTRLRLTATAGHGFVTFRRYTSYGPPQMRRKFGLENDEKDQVPIKRDQVSVKNDKNLLTHLNIFEAKRPWRY